MSLNLLIEYQTKCTNKNLYASDLCVLYNKYINEIPSLSFPDNASLDVITSYYQESLNFDTNKRSVAPTSNKYSDCFYNERKIQRPYPGTCYGSKLQENWESTKWWLYEVRGDLMYTFDYVLWDDKGRHKKENQFWYLILYLKTLVTLVENPIDIVNTVSYRLVDKVNELVTRVRDLEHKLPLLSTTSGTTTVIKQGAITNEVNDYTPVEDKVSVIKNGNIQIKP